jgi:hypothetical protein
MAMKKKSLAGATPSRSKAVDGNSNKPAEKPQKPVSPTEARKLTVAKLATAKLSTAKLVALRKFN